MKNYIRPIAEVSKFDVADIITKSGVLMDETALLPNSVEANLYDAYENAGGTNTTVAVFEW